MADLLKFGQRQGGQKSKSEPAKKGRPLRPRTLTEGAKKVWDRVAPELHKAGLLQSLDVESLACYCEAAAMHQRAMEKLAALALEKDLAIRDALIIPSPKTKFPCPNPLLFVIKQSRGEMLAWAKQLGLTPASRRKILADDGISADEADDPLAGIL